MNIPYKHQFLDDYEDTSAKLLITFGTEGEDTALATDGVDVKETSRTQLNF